MATAIGLRPMHQRPPAGSRLVVLMRDGRQLECSATRVYVGDRAGIVIYQIARKPSPFRAGMDSADAESVLSRVNNGRKAINESEATGWWPMAPRQ